ncbi:MAG: hypothetical protein ABIH55_01555 [Nanoarchaeota archaeon]|nr:hypothetical protein [Nanoarchaeota archaeon]MBU1135495.1 hypothetical protein [Nanoarchaeota archaeon]
MKTEITKEELAAITAISLGRRKNAIIGIAEAKPEGDRPPENLFIPRFIRTKRRTITYVEEDPNNSNTRLFDDIGPIRSIEKRNSVIITVQYGNDIRKFFSPTLVGLTFKEI